MRLLRMQRMGRPLMLALAVAALGGPEASACSGPRALETIRKSALIGLSLAGISIAIVVAGCIVVRRRSPDRRARWIAAPLVFHPVLWMDPTRDDCGYGLRWWSLITTLGIAIYVALMVSRSRPAGPGSKRSRRTLVGALTGTLVGLPLAALILSELDGMSPPTVVSYNPMLVWVEAPGYRTFIAPLGDIPATPDDRSMTPPLNLAFPPPPTATIRLSPSPVGDNTTGPLRDQADIHSAR